MLDIDVGRATDADARPLAELANVAYRGAGRLGWTHEADLFEGGFRVDEAMVRAMIGDSSTVVLVARSADGIVGCVQVETRDDVVAFGLLAVEPRLQNAGLGRRLVRAVEAFGSDRGAREVRLQTLRERGELVRWYERQGYQLTGDATPFPYLDPCFGVACVPDMHLVGMAKAIPAADAMPSGR